MAEESPQPVNPAVDPQVEDPPATAVPVAQVDTTPAPVDPAANPEVPQPASDLPEAFVYPAAETPTQDPILVAQAPGAPINDASTAVNRGTTSVPISAIGATPIDLPPGATEPRLIIDPNLPNVDIGTGGTTTVTAPRPPANDPVPVVIDETGTISRIQRNPETGELFDTGEASRQATPEQLRILTPTTPPPDTPVPTPPAQPPASQTQRAPAPAPAQDYGSSGDAAALEAGQRAENEAFRQGRIPQPVTNPPNPQTPATDGTTAGPGITGPVDGVSPYGEANDPLAVGDGTTAGPGITGPQPGFSPYGEQDDPRAVDVNSQPTPPNPGPYEFIDNDPVPDDINRDPAPPNPGPYDYIDNDPVPEPYDYIDNDPVPDASRDQALRNSVRNQQAINAQRGNNRSSADWRVRLRLAPGASYLYNAPNPGILGPLSSQTGTDGVIFPYTPTIQTVHKANYNAYDLTHSNYRGYFYQGSQVEDINVTATFTAQDTAEAEYLLAVIHFFRSVTKMFYGQDATFRGSPPPLVFLSGLGEFQYVNAPCVVASFNYNLPADVDYIRARSPNQNGTNLLKRRQRQNLPGFLSFSPSLQRLYQARLRKGGDPRIEGENVGSVLDPPTLGLNSPTYVPTRMEITIILHPMQSRKQVSQDFSLRAYSNGSLITRGFW